ncbi:MAG: hypothetical protein V4580_16915 [Bacteroidota bacterium]
MKSKDIHGKIALTFSEHKLSDLCLRHIPGFEPERFNIIAVRVFAGKEFIVTVFAQDNLNHDDLHHVRKFKIETLSHKEFYNYVDSYNFTLVDESVHIDGMAVLNK